ncbi:response regulator transcription factor [Ornithinimicrobium humiphilum]|uniref:DNA-binding response OmpR family regulator n=1 Tax=Ornithinimicrobium humiphilum TaxID=125288 RepID=A0A543K845_9MICO|nr:response regulator transcription factor [Ornithinimicrobium humiphilum]TQM91237.1 DNA-binding response OmpR family regulator [Ornithinimicrobium humiphilum]
MHHILVVEDEAGIARVIDRGLKAAGYRTTVVGDGLAALEAVAEADVDLVVLDVGLPRMDGFTVLRMLRTMEDPVPVIMCTARDSVEDTVSGLESGADDYLAKPFRVEELLARVRARLRKPASATTEAQQISAGGVTLDLVAHTAAVEGRPVELSAREFALARTLMEHAGQALSRDQLLDRVWGFEVTGASNVVDVYVRYLRTKLGSSRITTVRGVGYRFES